ncbi:cytochrome b-c1 complex subunit 2, mitochondrial [Episyrphus balteatus]|uniref:cytochrome b-c1 complex subunit 2, mitochondrial n=1 Tax=Episyrphus balteatus TaxID=286459 RepID=UPI0024852231|nr:cytochrome b-c1 complex subunit 2, mitochondrial [Episyrphus balteatus]
MASNASKVPFLRVVAKRGFAAQACPRPLGKAADVQSNVLPNKVVVATAESSLPVTRVSVVFRAGSRNENYDSLGANHIIRIAAGLTTKYRTGFSITRNLQQIGGSLTASSDRELLTYTIETTSDKQEVGLKLLQDIIAPAFKPWEISDVAPRIRTQVAAVPPQIRAVELLHRAAFRTGLGNSLYIPKHKIGKISSETLLHFVASNCTAGRCAVVGVGIDQNTLSGFAQSLELESGGGKDSPSKYCGGEIRKEKGGDRAVVAVAGEAVFANPQEALAYAVLERALAPQPAVKWGNTNGALAKAASSAAGSTPVCISALNATYSDGGLFGFVVSADAGVAGKAVEAAARVLKAGTVSGDDVNRGKALLKADILEAYGTDAGLIATLGNQAALQQAVQSADNMLAAVDSLSQSDIQSAARKAGSSKLSIGAIGNLVNVPYASDLS